MHNRQEMQLDERALKIVDLDLAYMAENYEQARQHESLRAQMTSMSLGLSGLGITAAFTFPRPLILMLVGLLVLFLGIFGRRFSLKHYERFKFHVAVARIARDGICQKLGYELEYRRIATNSRLRMFEEREPFHNRVKPYDKALYSAYRKKLYRYWLFLHRIQSIAGAVMMGAGLAWWMWTMDLLVQGY